MTPAAKFQPGDRVRARAEPPAGQIRTPAYVQGKMGSVHALYGMTITWVTSIDRSPSRSS